MDGLQDFKDLQGNAINDFYKAYRDDMTRSYNDNVNQINQQRENDYASIMSQANKRGMMYSNFPERSKMQYHADTYLPNLVSAHSTYQTGLDKLRSNAIAALNTARDTIEQTNHINSLATDTGTTGGSSDGSKKDGSTIKGAYETNDGYTFYSDPEKKNKVRFATWAKLNGYDNYLDAAKSLVNANNEPDLDLYNRLNRIYSAQQGTKLPNLGLNTGKNYQYVKYGDRLSDDDTSFLNSLGLMLTK